MVNKEIALQLHRILCMFKKKKKKGRPSYFPGRFQKCMVNNEKTKFRSLSLCNCARLLISGLLLFVSVFSSE